MRRQESFRPRCVRNRFLPAFSHAVNEKLVRLGTRVFQWRRARVQTILLSCAGGSSAPARVPSGGFFRTRSFWSRTAHRKRQRRYNNLVKKWNASVSGGFPSFSARQRVRRDEKFLHFVAGVPKKEFSGRFSCFQLPDENEFYDWTTVQISTGVHLAAGVSEKKSRAAGRVLGG